MKRILSWDLALLCHTFHLPQLCPVDMDLPQVFCCA
jgi:hypothetical protein